MTMRADFLRAQNSGCRQGKSGLGLEICLTPGPRARPGAVRVGFTASRKVGGAVERNRAKRRLRAAASSILPLYGRQGHDYVLVARVATLSRPFPNLLDDVKQAMEAGHALLDRKAQRSRGGDG